jgi:hypothetical protein
MKAARGASQKTLPYSHPPSFRCQPPAAPLTVLPPSHGSPLSEQNTTTCTSVTPPQKPLSSETRPSPAHPSLPQGTSPSATTKCGCEPSERRMSVPGLPCAGSPSVLLPPSRPLSPAAASPEGPTSHGPLSAMLKDMNCGSLRLRHLSRLSSDSQTSPPPPLLRRPPSLLAPTACG